MNSNLILNKYQRAWHTFSMYLRHPLFLWRDLMWDYGYNKTITLKYKGDSYSIMQNWMIDNIGIKYISWDMRILQNKNGKSDTIIKLSFWQSSKKTIDRIKKVM